MSKSYRLVMQIDCKEPHLVATLNPTDSALPAPPPALAQRDCRVETGLATWDECGSGSRVQPPQRIPIPNSSQNFALNCFSICFFFFLFSPDFHSLNKRGGLYGKAMRSVSPYVVPWVSHHHMTAVMEFKMLSDPGVPVCLCFCCCCWWWWKPWGGF